VLVASVERLFWQLIAIPIIVDTRWLYALSFRTSKPLRSIVTSMFCFQFSGRFHFAEYISIRSYLDTVHRLLARGLELPEDTFVNIHGFEASGESSGKYFCPDPRSIWPPSHSSEIYEIVSFSDVCIYGSLTTFFCSYPRTEEEETKSNNIWLKGHTGIRVLFRLRMDLCWLKRKRLDFGSITLLWSQPVSGLQIRSLQGKWQWIKHIDNALVRILIRTWCP